MTLPRAARLVAIAVVVGIGIATMVWAVTDLHFNDLRAYESAAVRLRSGEQLYGGDVTPFTKYYYAPWFAFAFVPLSLLPWTWLVVAWTSFTVGSSILAILPLLRMGTVPAMLLAGLMGPILIALSISGNVHAPMLALLVWSLPTRWGPAAIGIAASLKATPILLVAAYVGRRRYKDAAVAVAVAAVLWAPIVWFELAPITFESGGAALSFPVWLALGGAGALAALLVAYRIPRLGPAASAVASYLATPRLYVYDVTILLAAVPGIDADRRVRKSNAAISSDETAAVPAPSAFEEPGASENARRR